MSQRCSGWRCMLSHVAACACPSTTQGRLLGLSCALPAVLQVHVPGMLQVVFFADSADVGLRGPLLDGALLQLLPLGLSARLAPQEPSERLLYLARRLVRIAYRPPASLHSMLCLCSPEHLTLCNEPHGLTLCGRTAAFQPPGRAPPDEAHPGCLREPGPIRVRHPAENGLQQ